MERLATQAYYKMLRKIEGIHMETIADERELILYSDKIVTKYREFPLEKVFDLSYKKVGEMDGLLYLHTQQGVYPYTVKENPEAFIQAVKERI
ncbi:MULTISPECIES: hypothetical protein [unclassified Paenibacillus]|uniref:PH domain-containing protein n=1 Tax=Paenibacillus provencensis TaxID=441151 RepID=A0ABW3PTB6_9BACL|nr:MULTISPECIES: hypothetical protein [unclassified Paenibacillus]MCM3129149.1 hypothetical protein [Paenibacillus sp. MER 78]SFS52442.1 hypothetical protein SAMN04488601_1011357 [Paenibacillus sp. 453mf]